MTVNLWSQTAATNATADATVNWREGQAPSTVNNSARAMMAAVAKWRDDISGLLVTGGSSTAYTLTTNQSLTPLADGYRVTARMHATNGASPTLNVDSTGAKAIRSTTGVAIVTASMRVNGVYTFTYDSGEDCWYVHGFFYVPEFAVGGVVKMIFWQTSAPTGWTKDTANNDKALRVVSGSASTGGSVAFTTAFASQSVAGTIGGTAITINQMPLHGHPVRLSIDPNNDSHEQGGLMVSENDQTNFSAFTGTPAQTAGQQIGGTGGGATHDHSFTGTAINLAVSYVDVILATKD